LAAVGLAGVHRVDKYLSTAIARRTSLNYSLFTEAMDAAV
jgi:hypothetical protein